MGVCARARVCACVCVCVYVCVRVCLCVCGDCYRPRIGLSIRSLLHLYRRILGLFSRSKVSFRDATCL